MKYPTRLLTGALLAAVLTACGGGGGDSTPAAATPAAGSTPPPATAPAPTASAIDKYVGTWVGCTPESFGSMREVITITKTGDNTASLSSTATEYAQAGCTGTVRDTDSSTGTLTLVGTKLVGTETVDKVNVVEGGQSEKQILVVRGNQLFSGVPADEPGATVDAEGYPNRIDNIPLVRQ